MLSIRILRALNTKSNRTAIDEEEFAWIENAMPIGFGNIKIVSSQVTIKDGGNNAISFGNTVSTLTIHQFRDCLTICWLSKKMVEDSTSS
jgi:hypothetical protein